ncbi:CBS domain-containing protein CBSX3, mitochondrial isoform X2 [Daucus carota subsp. sativus]|uniref:CBS domain-containing protein CBSX3, mitochondrial isoform X2 n=1 Tax=Daucus carota subsp. sativus TaxID=79200 RepID=UPI0007F00289|nr:PREDICTED: CBS domain-containing protein CBSX3, mitochondrial-like isoform X2 [Daucus carota subsp. sativus]
MHALTKIIRTYQETCRLAVLQHWHLQASAHYGCVPSSVTPKGITEEKSPTMQDKGLENTTVAEVLMTKGEEKVGSWIWCRADDTVHDAVKQPGDSQLIAGIFTERDYLRKMIAQERPAKYTKVMEVMTGQNKLIAVTSDTNILQAMQLMTDNQIRHIPVIDGRIVGMISIVDVVRAVVGQQTGEMKRLNEFIKGDYY